MSELEYSRKIEQLNPVDVLVIGGGPAGIAAAVGAARLGVSTLLVERYGFLGGNLTAGLVGPCMSSYSLDGVTRLIDGVFGDFVSRMIAMGGAIDPAEVKSGSAWSGYWVIGHEKVTPFEPEDAKQAATELVLEAGASLLLHSFVVDTLTQDGRVTGVILANKLGLSYQPATVVVDCSGDGDVAAFAGAAMVQGRESDGLVQPATLFFRVSGVDDDEVERWATEHPDDRPLFESIVGPARADGRFPAPRRGLGLYKTQRPGVWRVNTTRVIGIDGTKPEDLTRAELEGRRQAHALLKFFQVELPGFRQACLLDTATNVGIRETRRIVGEFTVTLDHLLAGTDFDDAVAFCGYPVDIHSPEGPGVGIDGLVEVANAYSVPYRCLVPRDVDGLLVAGRCISATHEAIAAIRVMPPAFALGHAAGVAAALAVRGNVEARAVVTSELRAELRKQRAVVDLPSSARPAAATL